MSPRTNEQNIKIKDERREQILMNAMKLFGRRGLAATKISDIAQASGFSQGLVYHYFKSKEEVYTELVKRAVDISAQVLLEMEQAALEPLQKVRLISETTLKSLSEEEEAAYYFLLMTQAMVSEANPDEAREAINKPSIPFEVMLRVVAEGQKMNQICDRNPVELVTVFWAAVNGLALCKVSMSDRFVRPDPEILTSMFYK